MAIRRLLERPSREVGVQIRREGVIGRNLGGGVSEDGPSSERSAASASSDGSGGSLPSAGKGALSLISGAGSASETLTVGSEPLESLPASASTGDILRVWGVDVMA